MITQLPNVKRRRLFKGIPPSIHEVDSAKDRQLNAVTRFAMVVLVLFAVERVVVMVLR
jgi:hypothetical protein